MRPRRYVCGDCGSTNIDWARCSVVGCDHLVLSRGLCSKHYNRGWRRQQKDDGFWEQVDHHTKERLNVA